MIGSPGMIHNNQKKASTFFNDLPCLQDAFIIYTFQFLSDHCRLSFSSAPPFKLLQPCCRVSGPCCRVEEEEPCCRNTGPGKKHSYRENIEPLILDNCVGPYCRVVGPSFRVAGPSCRVVGPYCRVVEPYYKVVEPSCRVVGPSCRVEGPSCRVAGPSCRVAGPSCRVAGPCCRVARCTGGQQPPPLEAAHYLGVLHCRVCSALLQSSCTASSCRGLQQPGESSLPCHSLWSGGCGRLNSCSCFSCICSCVFSCYCSYSPDLQRPK